MNIEKQNLEALNELLDDHLKNADNQIWHVEKRVRYTNARKFARQNIKRFKLKQGKLVPRTSKRLIAKSFRAYKLQTRKSILLELASQNMSLNELQQYDKTELTQALKRYDEIQLARPCCSEYPGTFPFCNPNC
ncbi:hypothetical protein [Draconibacterium mangrovi]|uniref:hypothetical protein n=1 Tax=Draconibacterium mangrovi TaxID=2697469 RepID=UPI0013D48DDC|nr:hypothetical protein [Draconibacterium mangrovi]